MNIAIFTNNYLPNIYGVPMSIETFRLELEKCGHRVYIFAPKWYGYKDTNMHVFRYPSIDIEFKFRYPLPINFSSKIDKLLEKLELDIIHAQHPNLLGSVALKWARKKKIPLIFTWHTLYDKYTNFIPLIPEKMASSYIISQAVRYANKTDHVITPTDSVIPILRKWGVTTDITSVSTGIEDNYSVEMRDTIRQKYGVKDDETLLFSISRLTDEKNVEFLFRAVASVLEKTDKVRFLMAGDGYLLTKLEEFCWRKGISDRVFFTGLLPRSEVGNYLSAADIFVYASRSETQGIVILEAMCAKLPIVAVASTGINSLVRDQENGFLVENDQEKFSSAVMCLASDSKLSKRFGENSKNIVCQNYTSSVSAEKMLKVYNDAITKKNLTEKRNN